MLYKWLWAIRAVVYNLWWGRVVFPSYIGKPVYVEGAKNISIGRKARIFPGLRVEVTENGKLAIEDDVAIAQNVHITCGKSVVIKSGVCVAANACITDTIHVYEDISVNVLKQKDRYVETYIGEDSFIGFGAAINAGSVLGKHCIVGANAYVSGEFPDYSVIAGNPAKVVKRYDFLEKKWVRCESV